MASDAPVWIIGRHGQLARCLGEAASGSDLPLLHLSRPQLDFNAPRELEACLANVADSAGPPSGIINAAAYTAVDQAEVEKDTAMRQNAEAPARLAAFCADNQIPLIHISTDYVFSGRSDRPWTESAPTEPVNIYGESKLAGEEAVRASGAPAVIVRTSGVFSAFGSNFLKTMLRLAITRDEVDVVDDQITSPTPADALADCLLEIMNRMNAGKTASGVLHFSGDTMLSWADFARLVFRKGRELDGPACEVSPISSSDFGAAARRPAFSALDCGKIQREFGIEMPSLNAGVERAMRRLMAGNH